MSPVSGLLGLFIYFLLFAHNTLDTGAGLSILSVLLFSMPLPTLGSFCYASDNGSNFYPVLARDLQTRGSQGKKLESVPETVGSQPPLTIKCTLMTGLDRI